MYVLFAQDSNLRSSQWTEESEAKFKNTMETNYATDFLMDRGIEIIDNALKQDLPFAVMISIPEPHSPNVVRPVSELYDIMYDLLRYRLFVALISHTNYTAV